MAGLECVWDAEYSESNSPNEGSVRGNCRQDPVMNKNQPIDAPTLIFKEVISILEKNGRYLDVVGLKPATRVAYRKTIAYLKRLHVDEIEMILGTKKRPQGRRKKFSDPEISDAELRNLSADQIRNYAFSNDVSRSFLERIARYRFGMTSGALSVHSNRSALVDKLNTLLGHERTHEAITRAIESDRTTQRELTS